MLFIVTGMFFCIFYYLISDPKIDGESGRTGFGSCLLSLIPMGLGIVLFIFFHKIKRNSDLAATDV